MMIYQPQHATLPVINPSTALAKQPSNNRLKAFITHAISQTGIWDAFEFKDSAGQVIRVERANLKTYGTHWRIHHGNVTYVILYDTQKERVEAARKVHNYLLMHGQRGTLRLVPDSALDYWQDAPSRLVVL